MKKFIVGVVLTVSFMVNAVNTVEHAAIWKKKVLCGAKVPAEVRSSMEQLNICAKSGDADAMALLGTTFIEITDPGLTLGALYLADRNWLAVQSLADGYMRGVSVDPNVNTAYELLAAVPGGAFNLTTPPPFGAVIRHPLDENWKHVQPELQAVLDGSKLPVTRTVTTRARGIRLLEQAAKAGNEKARKDLINALKNAKDPRHEAYRHSDPFSQKIAELEEYRQN
ncbi:hypothetical protein FACS189472_10760 [Alphaproteobacteria bacterium]|nr:hypothetical protein FACS189472_10760 [Alphaproteobacteria bacterium]